MERNAHERGGRAHALENGTRPLASHILPSQSSFTTRQTFLYAFVFVMVLGNVLLITFLVGWIGSGGSVSGWWLGAVQTGWQTDRSLEDTERSFKTPLDGLRERSLEDAVSQNLRDKRRFARAGSHPLLPASSASRPLSVVPVSPARPSAAAAVRVHHVVMYNHNFERLPLASAHKPGESFHFNSVYQALLWLNRTESSFHLQLHQATSAGAAQAALNDVQRMKQCDGDVDAPSPSSTEPCHALLALISHTYDLCPNSDRCRPWQPQQVFQHALAPRWKWRLVDFWSTPPEENLLKLHPRQHWNPYPYGVNYHSGILILTAEQAELLDAERYDDYRALRLRELDPASQTADSATAALIAAPAPAYRVKLCFYGVGGIWFSTPRWERLKSVHDVLVGRATNADPLVTFADSEWMYSGDVHCGDHVGCDWFRHRHLVGPGQYTDWVRYLTTCTLMFATGEPIVSPTPLEAVGNGATFIDLLDNAHGPVHTHTVHGQSYQSQHPWVVRIVGPEYARLADWTDESLFLNVILEALEDDFRRYRRWVEERERWTAQRASSKGGEQVGRGSMEGFTYSVDQLAYKHHRVGRIHPNFTLEGIGRKLWVNMHDPEIKAFHVRQATA